MNIADLIIYGCLLFYFIRGFKNGFLRTLLSPIAMIAGSVLAYIYYQQTHDFLKSLILSVLAPFVITLILRLILKIWEHTGSKKSALGTFSRLGGGLLGVAWSGLWFVLVVILVGLLPLGDSKSQLKSVQNTILSSFFFARINEWIGDKIPTNSLGVEKITEVLEDPERYESLRETPEYEDLMGDENLQALLADKKTMEQIEKKDITGLLQNPKFQTLMQDEEILKKAMALHGKLMQLEKDPVGRANSEGKEELE